MAFICLARGDIPNGVVQVLDLSPNASLLVPGKGHAQTRYVNRPKQEIPHLDTAGKLVESQVDGLGAYILDRVEPGGLEQASGTLTMASPVHGDTVGLAGATLTATANFATGTAIIGAGFAAGETVVINGTTFTGKHAAPLAATEFLDAQAPNTAITSATSLVAQAGVHATIAPNMTLTNVGGTSASVTLTALARGLVGQYTLTEVGGNITVSGATLVAAVPNPALQQFASLAQAVGGTNAAVATSFRLACNDAATIAIMKAASGTNYATCAVPVGAVSTLTALDNAGAALLGPDGNLNFSTATAARLVQDAYSARTAVLNRTHQTWTPGFIQTAITALLARVDTGLALTATDLNTLCSGVGTDFDGSATASTGDVMDLLWILAGGGYRIHRADVETGVDQQYMDAGAPAYIWDATKRGDMSEPVKEYSANWGHGEIRPNTIGGDWVERPIDPIIYNVEMSDAFQASLLSGTLATFAATAGMPPVTLWPDSDMLPHYPWTFQGTLQYPEVTNARVLTVYDDSGNVLA